MKKIFYGWFMLAGLALMYATTNGVGAYALTVMRPLQIKTFGLDARSAALLPTLLFLTIAIASPFVGRLLDRYSPRIVIAIGAFGAIGLIFLQAYITNYITLCIFYVLYGICMSLAGIISFMYLVNKWFKRYKGMATGILILGSSLGGLIFPRIAVAAGADWQKACMFLGIASAVLLLPCLLLIKAEPTAIGTVPDGAHFPESVGAGSAKANLSLGDALRSFKFYLVLVVTGILWFCIKGYLQNHGFAMKDLGQSPARAAALLGYFSITAIAGKLCFGYLSDRIAREYIMVVSIAIMAASFFTLNTFAASPFILNAFALVAGFGFGGAFTIIQVWVADIYGGESYGSVLGVVTMVDELSGSAGMLALGSMAKASGNYTSGFDLMLVLCAVAIFCALLVRRLKASKFSSAHLKSKK